MTIQKNPTDNTIPTNPTVETKEWVSGVGETVVQEWNLGTPEDIGSKYDELKSLASAGGNIAQLNYKNQLGRASLVCRLGRSGGGYQGIPDDVTIVEEVYA